jgi:hypothetical protein
MATDDKKIDDLLKEVRLIKNLLVASLIASSVGATVIAEKILHYKDVSAISHELPVSQLKQATTRVRLGDNAAQKANKRRKT